MRSHIGPFFALPFTASLYCISAHHVSPLPLLFRPSGTSAPLHVDISPGCPEHAACCLDPLDSPSPSSLPQCLAAASYAAQVGMGREVRPDSLSVIIQPDTSLPSLDQNPGDWTLVPVGPIVTAMRECETLGNVHLASGADLSKGPHALHDDDLMAAILRPHNAKGFGLAQVWRWCGICVGQVWGWCGIGVGQVWDFLMSALQVIEAFLLQQVVKRPTPIE